MTKLYDVLIVGAGPVGLLLACELALGHASVLVLESHINPESPWKAGPLGMRGLNAQSIEAIYRRGLLNQLLASDEQLSSAPKVPGYQFRGRYAGHFAGIMLNTEKLELKRWKYRLPGPALTAGPTTTERIEAVLTERAESLGVKILRGIEVTKIVSLDDVGVTVEGGGNECFRGRWLVGCDGGRSVIRKDAGFEFVGTEPKYTAYSATCDLEHSENLRQGIHATKGGMYIFVQPNCLHLLDFDGAAFDRKKDITLEHLQDVLNRVTGATDVKIRKIHLVSSSTDRCKQASRYRKGRILLAGDAAHIHSPLGGQGMNLGLADAMNLGWKLAATVLRESSTDCSPVDLALLDTYESERHPVATWVLEWTRAQVASLQPDLYGSAVWTLFRDLIDTTDGTNLLIDRVWGLSRRYTLGNSEAHAHPLVGCSAPDFELCDGSRLGPKMDTGRGLLIEFEDTSIKELAVSGKYKALVDYLRIDVKDKCDLSALLIRPDGIVAWVAEGNDKPDLDAAKVALEQWFGE